MIFRVLRWKEKRTIRADLPDGADAFSLLTRHSLANRIRIAQDKPQSINRYIASNRRIAAHSATWGNGRCLGHPYCQDTPGR